MRMLRGWASCGRRRLAQRPLGSDAGAWRWLNPVVGLLERACGGGGMHLPASVSDCLSGKSTRGMPGGSFVGEGWISEP